MEKQEIYRILSDIFAVPGFICMFAGGLWWLTGQGAFSGVSYVLANAVRLLLLQPRKAYAPTKRKTTGCGVLMITGAVCLAAAGVLAGLFYRL